MNTHEPLPEEPSENIHFQETSLLDMHLPDIDSTNNHDQYYLNGFPSDHALLTQSTDTTKLNRTDRITSFVSQQSSFGPIDSAVQSGKASRVNRPTYGLDFAFSAKDQYADIDEKSLLLSKNNDLVTEMLSAEPPTKGVLKNTAIFKKNRVSSRPPSDIKPVNATPAMSATKRSSLFSSIAGSNCSNRSKSSRYIHSLVESLSSEKIPKRVVTTTTSSKIIRPQAPRKSASHNRAHEKDKQLDSWLLTALNNVEATEKYSGKPNNYASRPPPSSTSGSAKALSVVNPQKLSDEILPGETLFHEHPHAINNLLSFQRAGQSVRSSETIRPTPRFVKPNQIPSSVTSNPGNKDAATYSIDSLKNRSVSYSASSSRQEHLLHLEEHRELVSASLKDRLSSENKHFLYVDNTSNPVGASLSLQKTPITYEYYQESEIAYENVHPVNKGTNFAPKPPRITSRQNQYQSFNLKKSRPQSQTRNGYGTEESYVEAMANIYKSFSRQSLQHSYNHSYYQGHSPPTYSNYTENNNAMSPVDKRLSDFSLKSHKDESSSRQYRSPESKNCPGKAYTNNSNGSRDYPKNSITSRQKSRSAIPTISADKINDIRKQFTSRSHIA